MRFFGFLLDYPTEVLSIIDMVGTPGSHNTERAGGSYWDRHGIHFPTKFVLYNKYISCSPKLQLQSIFLGMVVLGANLIPSLDSDYLGF